MTYTAVSLVDPVSGTATVLMPRDGMSVQILDFQASVRAVSEERVSATGQVDYTLFLSAGSLSLSLILWPSDSGVQPEQILDEIGNWLSPALRPLLVVTNDQWLQQRQVQLRFDSKTAPVENPMTTTVQISWKAPGGCWQSSDVTEVIANAYLTATGGLTLTSSGLTLDSSGLDWTPATTTGSPIVTAGGNIPAPWTAKLYGPCTGPELANDTTGQQISFDDTLILAAGAYVLLDSNDRTALLNGNPAQSVLSALEFDQSDWWMMQAGQNIIRYAPDIASAGAAAVIDFQPCWLP